MALILETIDTAYVRRRRPGAARPRRRLRHRLPAGEARRRGFSGIGIDLSPESVEHATRSACARIGAARPPDGRAWAAPTSRPAGPFDLIDADRRPRAPRGPARLPAPRCASALAPGGLRRDLHAQPPQPARARAAGWPSTGCPASRLQPGAGRQLADVERPRGPRRLRGPRRRCRGAGSSSAPAAGWARRSAASTAYPAAAPAELARSRTPARALRLLHLPGVPGTLR